MKRRDLKRGSRSDETVSRGPFLKISASSLINASRNKRELGVVRDLGLDTLVMAKGERPGMISVDGWECLVMSTRPFGEHKLLTRLNRVASLATWAVRARRLRPSVISGHDIVGLLIAWLSTLFVPDRRRPSLVYDSHEFELGRSSARPRGLFTLLALRHVEAFLMRRCAFSIMVNDGIADRVQKIHGLRERPVVVRNTPSKWVVDEEACVARREEFCQRLGMPVDSFLLMYHGGVIPNRGVEVAMRALVGRESSALVILGNGDAGYIAQLRLLAEELGVAGRVLFHEAVPLAVLGEYVGAADAGVVLLTAVCENHLLALPNKFFENVQSLTPVIASDFPEIGSLVRQYNIGILVDPEDVNQVGDAMDQLRIDEDLRSRLHSNLAVAKSALCWEQERKALVSTYTTLIG